MSILVRLVVLGPLLVSLLTSEASANAQQVGGKSQAIAEHPAKYRPSPSKLPPAEPIGNSSTRLLRPYTGTSIDVATYHYDLNRTGWNSTETDLTVANVASPKFGLLATLTVDGNVFAQPLLLSSFTMPNGSIHDVLVIATGHNTVNAYDAQTYNVLWSVNLGAPQLSADVACDDVLPEYGITSTPVIVRQAPNKASLYIIAATEPSPYQFQTWLHELDIGSGKDLVPPVLLNPSAVLSDGSRVQYDAQNQWNRAGLAYYNGSLYVGIGSHCDNSLYSISGWLLRYWGNNLKLLDSFHTIETPGGVELASIWMTGFAPAIDSSGNVFVVTGNGDFVRLSKDWGESVLKLSPALTGVRSFFTPYTYRTLTNNDTDFGSGGVMLLPVAPGQVAPPLAVAMGKSTILYLLNQNSLGGERKYDAGALQAQHGGGDQLCGGPAYYSGPDGPMVFIQSGNDVLRGWSVNTGSTPALSDTLNGTSLAGLCGSLPIVSSNGAIAGTGVVWLIDRANEPFSIEAYDAGSLGAPIFSSQIGTWSHPDHGNVFLTPMEANGRVYAPGYKLVRVFGLLP